METRILINDKSPISIDINGRPILAIIYNGENVWPPVDDIIDTDTTLNAILSCFGMGIWVDDFIWNDNAIWID